MNQNIADLLSMVDEYSQRFLLIHDDDFSFKPNPSKWSKKEIVGHLIDSAQNNLRRFIVGQYETVPPKITYDQDFWVSANGYQQMSKHHIVTLWTLINQRIAAVWKNMPHESHHKQADTGKVDSQFHTLLWLAADYNLHMKHHINQIIPASFDVIYS